MPAFIEIVKAENGNIYFNGLTGTQQKVKGKTFNSNFTIQQKDTDAFDILEGSDVCYTFTFAQVASTQIMPAAAVPIGATTADEFFDLMRESFFFESVATSGAIDAYGGWSQKRNAWVNGQFVGMATLTNSTAFTLNTFYFFPVLFEGEIDQISFTIGVIGAASLVVGLYDSDANDEPLNKLWQSNTEITTGNKVYSAPLDLERGLYWMAVLTSVTGAIILTSNAGQMFNIMGLQTGGSAQLTHKFTAAYPFVATLPSIAPTATNNTSFIVPMLNFKYT